MKKIVVFIGIIIVVIGFLIFSQSTLNNPKQKIKPLMGQEVKVLSRDHVPDGTKIIYNSNPPAAGAHYALPQDAGIYSIAQADGYLVHSLEHGAIILWYNPNDLSKTQITQLQSIFKSMSQQKKIMTPRLSLDTPVALSSWGRILKLNSIDESQIKAFFETNYDRGPEQAPI